MTLSLAFVRDECGMDEAESSYGLNVYRATVR